MNHNTSRIHSLILIDSQLPDLATLQAGLPGNAEVHLLSPLQDGLTQLSEILDGRSNIASLHLITHGAPGKLFIGNSAVDREILCNSRVEMEAIANAMREDGELLIYGCEVAAGYEGRQFIDALTEMTGLKVAAATHKVGCADLGGRWELDFGPAVRSATLRIDAWQGCLAAPSLITDLGGDAGFGENSLDRDDDPLMTTPIDITLVFDQGLKFGSTTYTGTYINNNGMITFGQGFASYTPTGISQGIPKTGGGYLPLISLFWTDIDTNHGPVPVTLGGTSTGSNLVYWDIDTDTTDGDGKKITFTWDDVGLYPSGGTSVLAGQIILYDAGSGNMNIEFRYEHTGNPTAAAGWNVGVRNTEGGREGIDYYQISAPGNLSWLATTAGNTGLDGVYRWYLRDGAVSASAGSINYSVNTFVESASNDGSIATTIAITLQGDTFTGSNGDNFVTGSKVTVGNVPPGLTVVVTRTGDTTATLTLTGNADDHLNGNDIANLTVSFADTALSGGNASIINNAINQAFRVDFIEASNAAPSGLGNLTLAAVNEDTTAPAGAAINTLTGLSFADTGGDTLSGVAVIANTANATTQGAWQYSTNGGTHWYAVGTVSNTEALSLSATTLVRFVPVANYFGEPPSLTVRALDSSAEYFSSTGATETRVKLDASSNGGFSAISASTNTISTSITAVNDAPTVTSSDTTTYTENADATAVNLALTIADVDNNTLSSATVSITSNFQTSQDVLAFTNNGTTMGNIAGTYDATTGVLTLTSASASATVAEWQTALRAVTYANTSDAPTTASRTVSFVVNDGALNSAAGTRTVSISAVNDAPVIANLNADAPSGTTGSAIKLDAGTAVAVTDADSANFNTGTLVITTASGTADGNWSLDGSNAKAGADAGNADGVIAASEKVYVGATEIGTVHGTHTGQSGANLTITFNVSATPTLVGTLLQNLSYTSSTTGARNFDVVVKDASAGATSLTSTVTLTVNNPPSDSGPSTPPVAVTTVDGATVTTSTTTTTDGRVLEVVTITPISDNRQESTGDVGRADIALYYSDSAQDVPATTASLPTGIGLTSTGARTPANNTEALANLIALVNQTAGNTETNRVDMVSGGESFLARLEQQADKGPLIINSIKLTVAPGQTTAPDKPITITGSTDRVVQGSGNGNGGAPVEAIVIDTRALPPGTVLELKDIEFAVIVGDNVTIRGGEGKNIVFAGSGSQNIVLGEGDDELYGGDGDDVIGSEGGDDRLFGNAGNDTLFGGAGNDLLHGGVGNDVATYTGNRDQYEIVRDHGKTIVRSLSRSDDVDTVVNIETLRFDDSTYSIENPVQLTWIATLYQEVLGRQAELGGFQYWAAKHEAGLGIGTIALSFLHSAEYNTGASQQFAELSASDQLNLLYEHFLGRGADASGHAYWMEHMGNGMNINDVAQYFVVSNEMQGSYVQASGWEFFV